MSSKPSTKPSLTVVVGAGASMPLGVPSTWGLTELVKTALRQHKPRPPDPTFQPRVEKLLAAAELYYGEKNLNFEHILDVLESACTLVAGWKAGPTVSEGCLTQSKDDLDDVLDWSFIHECMFVLKHCILDAMTAASAAAATQPSWATYRSFWEALAADFTLTIVTLNYDTLVEQALGLDGSHQGLVAVKGENVWRLDQKVLQTPSMAHRLLHLHGSIQFGRREYNTDPNRFCYEDGFHELYWHPSPEAAQRTIAGGPSPQSQSGRWLETGPIITGLHKPDKLLVEPLASYYVESANQIIRCKRLLVIGYGFADRHINALLARMTRVHGASRRTAAIDYVDMEEECGSTRRSDMFIMLQRWGEERYEIDPFTNPYPWRSANCCARFYWKGLLEVADNEMDELVEFLKT